MIKKRFNLFNMGFENSSFKLIFLVCLLLSSLLFSVKAKDNTESDEGPSFSYNITADDGPLNWGNLDPEWELCGAGKSQSPIHIFANSVQDSPSLGHLIRRYKPAPAVIIREVHEVMVEWTENAAGGIEIDGTEYNLAQCHWHTGAEHKFNGISYDAELHLVHTNAYGDIAVVGILYELGPSDPFLTWLLPYLRRGVSELGYVNPFWIGLGDTEYYRYNGSLTTPPCSENVTWTLFKTVRTVSQLQILILRNAIQDGHIGNARPIQSLNGRTVYSFQPTISSI